MIREYIYIYIYWAIIASYLKSVKKKSNNARDEMDEALISRRSKNMGNTCYKNVIDISLVLSFELVKF